MLSTVDVKNDLKQYVGTWFDEVWAANIPENEVSATKTMALVTDVLTTNGIHAGDKIQSLNKRIQIQIFYSVDIEQSPQKIEVQLIQHMQANGWKLNSYSGHGLDPDTKQSYVTLQFSQNFLLKG